MTAAPRALPRRIAALPPTLRLAAVSAGLAVCSPDEAEPIALALIELALEGSPVADPALAELARRWPALPASLHAAALAAGRGRWHATLGDLAATGDAPARAASIDVVTASKDLTLLGVLTPLVGDSDVAIARRAERTLFAATEAGIGLTHSMSEPAAPAERPPFPAADPISPPGVALRDAIASALCQWETHQSRTVLLAALALHAADDARWFRSDQLAEVIERQDAVAIALRGALRWSKSPATRRVAWRQLGTVGPLAVAALDRVAWAASTADHAVLAESAALLLNPRRAVAWRTVAIRTKTGSRAIPAGGPVPDREAWSELPERARAGVPRLIAGASGTRRAKRAALEPALADPSPSARLAALAVADSRDLDDWLFDTDPDIARHAAHRWSMVGVRPGHARLSTRRERTLQRAARSPHPAVRAWSHAEARRLDPWTGTGPASRLAARQRLAADRSAFLAELAGRCLAGEVPDRISALALVRPLRLASDLLPTLERVAGDPDDRVAATAARALEGCVEPAAATLARDLLQHSDARVRANATEALAARPDDELPAVLIEMSADAHHRVRGSVVREGARLGGDAAACALETLRTLLADRDPAKRLAGAWAAERAACTPAVTDARDDLRSMLVVLAAEDADLRVRRRARRAEQRLTAGAPS